MQIESLKVYCDLAETESFTKAAQINGVTQSAVSQQISALERQFKSLLIERSKRKFRLTREGEVLYDYSKKIIAMYESLHSRLQEIKDIISGNIRVTTIYSIGLHDLPPYLKKFLKSYPTVNVHVEYRRANQVYEVVLGNIVDAHDGCLEFFKGKYYLYGTRYGSTDGFGKTNRYVCYSSPDLVTWTPHGEILKDAPPRTYYRPYVKFNRSTGKYVMWYNADNQYGVAIADEPSGPFIISNPNVPMKYSSHGIGDMGLFIDDDGAAYLAYTVIGTGDFGGKVEPISHHQICVEKLTGDYLSSTQVASAFVAGNCEGPAMFKRKGIYYLLFDNTCCFGVDGSGARVFTSTSPMGPFQYMGNINIKATSARNLPSPWTPPGSGRPDCIIKAQQTHVATLPTDKGTVYIWMGDRWGSRPDGIKGHDFQFWSSPLQFEEDGMIKSLTWDRDIGDKNFVVRKSTSGRIVIDKAAYGDLAGKDPRRILDLTNELQQQMDSGEDVFTVGTLIHFKGDPAFGFVKTLKVEFHVGGTAMSKSATDPESIDLRDAGEP
ncbi:MAG: family 43 glycosylhydrolase [Verrucomicrobiota bacterium]